MKKILILHILLFIGISFFISFFLPAHAQFIDLDKNMLGVSCGVGGATDKSSKCCDISTYGEGVKKLPSWVEPLPLVGGIAISYNEKAQALEDARKTMLTPCLNGIASTTDYKDPSCKCQETATSSAVLEIGALCKKYLSSNAKEIGQCLSCMNSGGYYSGLGCMPLELPQFISQYILGMGIGLAGGIAMLCIMYSAFRMQTSQGNPEAIKKAQENLTACITGLVLIIFSVLILRIIALDILRIPGFN